MIRIIAWAFRFLPQKLLSRVFGHIVRIDFGVPLLRKITTGTFRLLFAINLDDAENKTFKTIEDLFTRKLKVGSRSIQPPFCSPADGKLTYAGVPPDGEGVQVKGSTYSFSELIWGEVKLLRVGWSATVYLAPWNYHRVHSPVSGKLTRVFYHAGALWPVNGPFLAVVPKVFTSNERLVFEIALRGGGNVWVVMVGSFNVGRMTTRWVANFATNDWSSPSSRSFEVGADVACGDELGVFMLGSTVVLVLDELAARAFNLLQIASSQPILMGEGLSVT